MGQNNTVGNKTNFDTKPEIPDGQKLKAEEWNQVSNFQKSPVQQLTAFDDDQFIIDGTKNYSTTKVIAGATHTITAAVSGQIQGNNIKVRYQFNIDCTITLVNFDTLGNNTGGITPITSGTYDLIFYSNASGVNLEIPMNLGGSVDVSNKLDKIDPADQSIVSNVEFRGQAHANNEAGTIKTFSATPTFNFNDGNDQQMPVTGNITTFSTSNSVGSARYTVWLINDGTAGRTVSNPVDWDKATSSDDHSDLANAENMYQFFTRPDGAKKYSILNI